MQQIVRKIASENMHQLVIANGLVFSAGQVANDLSGDIKKQTAEVLAKVDALLMEAGTSRDKLIDTLVWLSDISDFEAMNEVWKEWLGNNNQPVRACVGAKLADPGYLIEIKFTALA